MRISAVVGAGALTLLSVACGSSSGSSGAGTTGSSGRVSTSGGAGRTGGTTGTAGAGTTVGGTTGAGTTGTTGGQLAAGSPCSSNAACQSDICGAHGSGMCCSAACSTSDATCGATGCDDTGACVYPAPGSACGTVAESCANGTQQNPSACDGVGNCNNNPGTTDCTPYICGTNACLTSCTDGASCGSGAFCDVANTACCTGLGSIGTLAVDSQSGSDAIACCGIGANRPCQTLHQAMKLIDSAQAQGVTITATVGGADGDWAAASEVYPIVLGWGVELSAAGVFFTDVSGAPAIFDIAFYSSGDSLGYASIVGTGNQVSIGMDSLGKQSADSSAIEIEAGNSLYIANATVNGSASNATTAITVNAGGSLWLAANQSATVTGTVTIGNDLAAPATDGYNGIVCLSKNGQGCTVSDAMLNGGGSSLVIEGQEGVDIDAEDEAVVTLTSSPIVGVPPKAAGFENCANKPDSLTAGTEAILLNGSATMTFSNGTVQCISGDGFVLQAADNLKTTPTLTLSGSTIQNTEYAVYATAGSVTIKNSTIQYNYNGVLQGTDKTNIASVDLSGGGVGTNSVVCSNSVESVFGGGPPAVSVLNTTTNDLDADDVNWDTNNSASVSGDEPDLFSCDSLLMTCSCEDVDQTCTNAGGVDGMDAVYTSTGIVTQKGAGLSGADCTVQGMGQNCGKGQPCPPGQCCNGLNFMCQPGQICPG